MLVLGAVELTCSFLPAESLDTRSLRLRAQTMDDNLMGTLDLLVQLGLLVGQEGAFAAV